MKPDPKGPDLVELLGEYGASQIGAPRPEPMELALIAIDTARLHVMHLYGGNLDHPALDHLESAYGSVMAVDDERKAT